MRHTQTCAQCRAPFEPIIEVNSLIHRPGATLRAICGACMTRNIDARRAARAAITQRISDHMPM